MKYFIEFMFYVIGLMVFVAGLTFGIDREIARRDFERYNTSQQEQIVGCIYKVNCAYYNDLLDKQYD